MADRPHDEQRSSLVALIGDGVIDAELAALVWLLAEGGLPIHVAGGPDSVAERLAESLVDITPDIGLVPGRSLEEALASTPGDQARLGIVLVAGRERVVAAHYVRPPLLDAGGHIHAQGPAVLATWEQALESFEHFAWGITPELAERIDRRPGDFEIERDGRREYLAGLAAAGLSEPDQVRAAMGGYPGAIARAHHH